MYTYIYNNPLLGLGVTKLELNWRVKTSLSVKLSPNRFISGETAQYVDG
jgi:hypothetical protein